MTSLQVATQPKPAWHGGKVPADLAPWDRAAQNNSGYGGLDVHCAPYIQGCRRDTVLPSVVETIHGAAICCPVPTLPSGTGAVKALI